MGLSSLTQSLEGVHPENLANFNFTMFRFVALFAFVAVAAAEPQWGLEHMKTPSGDTVSVQAAKVQHHQMKTAEYVKKGYASPIVYANSAAYAPYSGVPVYNQGVAAPVYNHGVYSYGLHHLGKRDADSDSQYIYSNGVYNSGIYANGYNGYAVPKVYNTVASPVHSGYNGVYNGVYNTYAGIHHLGKRDADSDSAMVYSTQFGGYPYTNTATFGNIYNAGIYSSYPSTYYSGYTGHRVFKREAEADSQWVYNNAYTPYSGFTGYTGYTGYAAPYNYGNVWNRAQYVW